MAVEEINREGGVRIVGDDGRARSVPFRLREFGGAEAAAGPDDRARRGADLARWIARDPHLLAVLGHSREDALAASIVYDSYGVVFLTPSSPDPALTAHRSHYVFRVAPNGPQIARAMVELIPRLARSKPVHIAVLYPETWPAAAGGDIARRLAVRANAMIRAHHGEVDFRVVAARRYAPDRDDPEDVVRRLTEAAGRFNVVLIADVAPYAERLRTQLEAALRRTPVGPPSSISTNSGGAAPGITSPAPFALGPTTLSTSWLASSSGRPGNARCCCTSATAPAAGEISAADSSPSFGARSPTTTTRRFSTGSRRPSCVPSIPARSTTGRWSPRSRGAGPTRSSSWASAARH